MILDKLDQVIDAIRKWSRIVWVSYCAGISVEIFSDSKSMNDLLKTLLDFEKPSVLILYLGAVVIALVWIYDMVWIKRVKAYYKGIVQKEYIEWELNTLRQIYHCQSKGYTLVELFGKEYPSIVVTGSDSIRFPFDSLCKAENLDLSEKEIIDYKSSKWYRGFCKIVAPNIHHPDLIGYANIGFFFDENQRINGFKAEPRTYKETVYTCHILQYELWKIYQIKKKAYSGAVECASLDELPMRSKIHNGKTPIEVLISGCNRSSLCDVNLAILALNEVSGKYEIAVATRSELVATFPGYLSIVPSGGFELYELENMQNENAIRKNFKIISALYREYIEEIFGDEAFEEATGDDDLNRLYHHPQIRALKKGIETGTFHLEFLGVDFELVTLRQNISFVLKIDDSDYLFDNRIRKNSENTDLRFIPVEQFETYFTQNRKAPLMPESAALFNLMQSNHLFIDAKCGVKSKRQL